VPLSRLCAPETLRASSRPALVVGHPGHELRVFGWMSEYKPRVYVMTDGSGRHGVSRVPSTARLIGGLDAEPGEIFGLVSDAEIYHAILERNCSLFLNIADAIASSFLRNRIDFVAGDATEGFNPTHDICRTLVNAAVLMARRASGTPILNYEFCLTEWQQDCEESHGGRCLHFRLDDELLDQKLNAAEAYVELRNEVRQGIAKRGKEYFRIECLKEIAEPMLLDQNPGIPFYESWGEERVSKGKYGSVIRLKEHMLPISKAICNHASCVNVDALLCES
jgi:hypothetical protein